MKIFKEITTIQDVEDLATDICASEQWTTVNCLPLNVKTCKIITFTRRRNPIPVHYSINREQIEQVNEIRDLGVIIEVHFANAIWGPTTTTEMKALESLQKRFLILLYFRDFS